MRIKSRLPNAHNLGMKYGFNKMPALPVEHASFGASSCSSGWTGRTVFDIVIASDDVSELLFGSEFVVEGFA